MTARRSPLRTAVDLLFWLIVVVLLVATLSVLTGRRLFDRIDEEIRLRAEAQLASCFAELQVSLGAARRVEGAGLELHRVEWREPGGDAPLATAERMLVRCNTDFTDWVRGDLRPTSIDAVGVRLRIAQAADGSWTAARRLLPRCDAQQAPLPLQVRDLEAEVHLAGASAPVRVAGADFDLLPYYAENCDYAQLRLIGRVGQGGTALRVKGHLDPREGTFRTTCRASRHALSPELLAAAARLGASLQQLRVRGTLHDIHSTVSGGVGKPLRYCLSGELRGGRIEHPRLPTPLDNAQMQLSLDQQGLRVSRATATAAGAELRARQIAWQFEGRRLEVDAEVERLRFDRHLAAQLPEAMRRAWQKHEALGEVTRASWQFQASAKHGMIRNQLDVECRDLSFHFASLPYRFHRAAGAVAVHGRRMTVKLLAPVSGQQVRIVGDLRDVGGERTYGSMDVSTAGPIPLSGDMINALSPSVQQVVRSFQPRGTLQIRGRMQRDAPGGPLRRQVDVELNDLSVSFEKLPYPVDHIHGEMKMVDDHWTFDVAGRNDSAKITCQGDWTPDPADGQHLKLRFAGSQLAMDAELRQAMSPSLQRLWQRLRPRGTIDDVIVDFSFDALRRQSRTRVALWKRPADDRQADRSPRLAIHPPSLPYELDRVTGKVVFEDGVVALEGLRAVHGQSVWEAQGRCFCGDDAWTLDFTRLIADNLRMDRELLGALPASLAPQVSQLQLRGPIDLDGRLRLRGGDSHSGPQLRQASWDMTLDVEQCSLRCGELPLEKIRGQLRVRGTAEGGRLAANGDLEIDSLLARGINVRELRGPLSISNDSLRLGSWASTSAPRQLRARVFGGVVGADAELKLDDSRRFELSASLANGQLSEIARSAVPVGGHVAGQANGTILLSGTTRGTHSLKGEGYVEMSNADIYEVPVIVTLLRMLSARDHDRSLISRGDANFRIVGDRVYLDQLELDGAVRLKGAGDMNFQRQINLNLYTAVGGDVREGGPTLPLLFREASRRILEIQVAGTLDRPEITRRALPELNDTLQRLFPEVSSNRRLASPLPSLRGRLQRR